MRLTDAEVAITAAEAGAAVVRARYGSPGDRQAKLGIDFVTETDHAAERAILDVVRGQPLESGAPGLLIAADASTHQNLLAVTRR